MPETEAVDKLLLSALIPCGSISHGFQSRKSYFRHVIDRFTFVQLLCSLLTDFLLNQAFCLLAHAVKYQPLEREAPQGGLKTLPVKRIREANHPIRDCQSAFVRPLYLPRKGTARFFSVRQYDRMSLISSKVMMNKFQRTYPVTRIFIIFESVLIHRRTHNLPITSATRQVRQQWFSGYIFPLGQFFGLTGNRPQSAPACSFLR